MNEAEMCSLVACTRYNIAIIYLTFFFLSKHLIFLNGDKQYFVLEKSSRKARCLKANIAVKRTNNDRQTTVIKL